MEQRRYDTTDGMELADIQKLREEADQYGIAGTLEVDLGLPHHDDTSGAPEDRPSIDHNDPSAA